MGKTEVEYFVFVDTPYIGSYVSSKWESFDDANKEAIKLSENPNFERAKITVVKSTSETIKEYK